MKALGLLMAASLVTSAVVPSAQACGGFFCNAINPVPIYQAGERILFAKHDGLTTMHIEIQYAGSPTDFGWVMPLAELPTDQDGDELALEEALQLSHPWIFDTIQSMTNPRFTSSTTFDNCEDTRQQVLQDSAPSFNEGGTGGSDGGDPGAKSVQVVEEAQIGPYEAQLIKATDTDALFTWLNENGYYQDENARPILKEYVKQEFVFLGLRLQAGKDTGDLKPVALTLGELAPCVPLRLTSIAATPGMPILTFILGEHRAVPKNHLHAQVNPKALIWPGASNYTEVLGKAIDQASGHAFITEYAGPTDQFARQFYRPNASGKDSIDMAETLMDLTAAYRDQGYPQDGVWTGLLMKHVPMPEGLTGWAYNCPLDEERQKFSCVDVQDQDYATSEVDFYGALDYWSRLDGVELTIDLEGLRTDIKSQVIAPLKRVQALFDGTQILTRLYTSLDPEEMTKDPIFAFNPDLPLVPRAGNAAVSISLHNGFQCGMKGRATVDYPDGTSHMFACDNFCQQATWGPVLGAEPLKLAEVLDEHGDGLPVHTDDVGRVDMQLTLAQVGQASLPDGFEVKPPAEARRLTLDPGLSPSGCTAASATTGSSPVGLLAFFMLAIVALRRRVSPQLSQ